MLRAPDPDPVAWFVRRKESLENREPERLRLWVLLPLAERVRLENLSAAANSAL